MILLATTDAIPNRRVVKTIGLVTGTVTRSTDLRSRARAMIKSWLGGEIEEYTKTVAEVREQALDRLRDQAREHGANAVLAVRLTSIELSRRAAELVAYGTAVVLAGEDDAAPRD
jgi:uncharacterized protein YbjQ (UPF0145 family)